MTLPKLWWLRHGETEWSRSGRYTGLTDLPLTERGEEQALSARSALAGVDFDLVLSSPSQRARRTAELAGFPTAIVEPLAHEWDYGDYEGVDSAEVRRSRPGYLIWQDGVPGGETIEQVAARADAVIARVLSPQPAESAESAGPAAGRVVNQALLVAHGHFLRVLTARWLDLPATEGRHFVLGTAKVCTLGWDKRTPAVEQWGL
ncbi:MAG: histidine phosphatase family protein [Renibacterium salmoninarum]|nr:histidine phosphatase family protein [Renibacterium salmoninarum]